MDVCFLLVDHFLRSRNGNLGYGCFKNHKLATELAAKISLNAVRKFYRYSVIPKEFFKCLHALGLISAEHTPQQNLSIDEAKKILIIAGFLEGFSKEEFKILGLQIQSGSMDHYWRRGEEDAKLYNIKPLYLIVKMKGR